MAVSNEKNTINIKATIYENIQNPVLNDTTNYTVLMGSTISLISYDVDSAIVNKYSENTNYKTTFIQNTNFHTNL
jgi:hypothetical protein